MSQDDSILYFAYGSNMFPPRLQERCKSARAVGTALRRGAALAFVKPSKDGSGKATLLMEPDSVAYGVIYRIDRADLLRLDRFEGCGRGYNRDDAFAVECRETGARLKAIAYLADEALIDRTLRPYDWYRAYVLAGALQHYLPQSHIDAIALISCDCDLDDARCQEARRILARGGYLYLLPPEPVE